MEGRDATVLRRAVRERVGGADGRPRSRGLRPAERRGPRADRTALRRWLRGAARAPAASRTGGALQERALRRVRRARGGGGGRRRGSGGHAAGGRAVTARRRSPLLLTLS